MSSSSRSELRMVAGFALVPPTAAVLAFVAFLVLWRALPMQAVAAGTIRAFGGSPTMDQAVAAGMGAGLLAVFVTVFGAVPAVAWLRSRAPLSLRRLLFLGAALGNAPFLMAVTIGFIYRMTQGTLSDHPGDLFYGIAGLVRVVAAGLFVGMLSAAMFWFVAFAEESA